ncbi:PAS domain S-box protein [Halorientalis pallida]|uniref:PAS domain S-box protein n=1 Tax=Halorientalis pallida TaxID=2479928 RepID=UPI003C6FAC87
MSQHAEQLVGTLFRVLAEEGHEDVQNRLLDAYHTNAPTDRDELTEDLISDIVAVLHRELGARAQVDVLTTSVEYLVERFLAVVEAVPVAVIVVGPEGDVQLWNDGAARTFGWSESEIRGEPYRTLLAPGLDDSSDIPDQLRNGEQLTGAETRHRHADGSILDVRLWAAPLHRRNGEFDGATVVVSDITEQKQREQRLTVLNRVLRHNIRNDLTVARGHLDMLADGSDGDTDHIAVIEDHLTNVVELSDAARHIEQLRDPDDGRTIHDLGPMVREQVDRLRQAYPDARIDCQVPESAPVVAHDLLPYALDNILENAAEHNPSATPRVSVAVSGETDGEPRYRTVEVEDDGPGLPETERAVLTKGTETALTHSDGIGLWLTRWILRSSGGKLTVDTSSLGGTSVAARLQAPPD